MKRKIRFQILDQLPKGKVLRPTPCIACGAPVELRKQKCGVYTHCEYCRSLIFFNSKAAQAGLEILLARMAADGQFGSPCFNQAADLIDTTLHQHWTERGGRLLGIDLTQERWQDTCPLCGDFGWMKVVQGSRRGVTFGCGACKTRFFISRYKGLLGFLVQRDFTIGTGPAHLQAIMSSHGTRLCLEQYQRDREEREKRRRQGSPEN